MKFKYLFLFLISLFYQGTDAQNPNHNSISERPTVGLVLSGGGAKGFAYIGLLNVLQEVNLPIDYVSGSSIGAIIAGMYAMGYHPDTIQSLIRQEDWDMILSNRLERKYVSFDEKIFNEKYTFTLPISNKKVKFTSLSGSLHVDLMLNRFFTTAPLTEDFNELQTPFLCIGTEVLNGDGVILNKGNLPRAIRASMAIPGYFTPVEIEGRHYVDGGIVNNYPAKELKEMGADIIIGGDVQDNSVKAYDDIENVFDLFDHIVGYNRNRANHEGMKLTDHYVRFDMPYGMLDFTQHDSIIALGERVARLHYDELKHLADSLNALAPKPLKTYNTVALDSLLIQKVIIDADGFEKESSKDFKWIKPNSKIAIQDIEETMKYVYGKQYFGQLYHEFKKDGDQTNLIIHAEDPKTGHIAGGINFNSDYGGNLLFNLTYRHPKNAGYKVFSDFIIGRSPRWNAMMLYNRGPKPGFGINTDFYNFDLEQFQDGEKINIWNFANMGAGVFVPMEFKNKILFKAGYQFDMFRFRQDIIIDSTFVNIDNFKPYGNAYVSFLRDSRDKINYGTSGSHLLLKAKYVHPMGQNDFTHGSVAIYGRFSKNISISKNWVIRPGIFAGSFLGDRTPPVQHLFGFGGQSQGHYLDNIESFTGYRFIETLGKHAGKVNATIQYNFLPDLYADAIFDYGINVMEQKDLLFKNMELGYGLRLGYNSFIGPLQITFMGNSMQGGPTLFLNFGFWL